MRTNDDKRLIEDYLPIEAISEEGSREKNVRKGHISTLHLWWARRPLVACRAAVYGALVPVSQFVPNGGTDAQKKSLGRANAAKFVKSLCQYPSVTSTTNEAQEHILKAHAERLTEELADGKATGIRPAWAQEFKFTGERVGVDDIQAGRAPRPRVLDMFAGGGAIPLEALRLGCEAYALDLNPVAHIIQLCTLVYPQKFGKPDPNVRGMTGSRNAKCETTWGGLAEEVRYWGNWVLEKVRAEIGDLYPPIPDPEAKPSRAGGTAFDEAQDLMGFAEDAQQRLRPKSGYLMPVAYLWTRTVKCKNPVCGAVVPLVRQTWLCQKPGWKDPKGTERDGRYVALRVLTPENQKRVRFQVVEVEAAQQLGFDPEDFSKAGNATCPFCGTVADNDYVRLEGCSHRMGQQLMGVIATAKGEEGKRYFSGDDLSSSAPDDNAVQSRINSLCAAAGLSVPTESVPSMDSFTCKTHLYGLTTWDSIFTPRQLLSLLTFASSIKSAHVAMRQSGVSSENAIAVATLLACTLDKQADFNSSLCVLKAGGGRGIVHTFGRQALPMVWDFAEANPLCEEIACWRSSLKEVITNLQSLVLENAADVRRGSALALPYLPTTFDCVVTDPPYYDNVSYANLSDFFYVWLRRSVGHLYPEHFATDLTPKKSEAVAEASRHDGDKAKAREHYEEMMLAAFQQAERALKSSGVMVVVYAHKTTLGWATLVDSLRRAGFCVNEAWPLDTETSGRLLAQGNAALASSIFLVAGKRVITKTGDYDGQVRGELSEVVRERVDTLWDMGISGADLVIACVGAGLRAFTRFARVEYANGEEVPAERFLTEVETVVLETIFARLSKEVGGKAGQVSLAGLDAASRFYILWRYTYDAAELEAGEAIIFSNGTHVELDGPQGLTTGADYLVEKKKGKYRLRDFCERGDDEDLGMPSDDGQAAPLVDALHRTLWLMEKRPVQLVEFLRESQVNREQLRLVAQALAGPALKGGELGHVSPTAELSALAKLTANWESVVEDAALTGAEKEERKTGQRPLKL